MARFNNLKFKKVFLIGFFLYFVGVMANEKQLYKISLHEPYNSERNESAKLLNADSENAELAVNGNIHIKHLVPGQTYYDSIVMYIADKNGYRAIYQIKPTESIGLTLSGSTLKVITG